MENEPGAFLDKGVLAKNFAIWTVVCGLFAAYSFFVASSLKFNPWAMALGVLIFVGFYTFFSSTNFYKSRVRKNRTLFTSLVIAFSIKLALTYPVDFYVGMAAVGFVKSIIQPGNGDFAFTLLITLTAGVILNAMIWIMVLLICWCRSLHKRNRCQASL